MVTPYQDLSKEELTALLIYKDRNASCNAEIMESMRISLIKAHAEIEKLKEKCDSLLRTSRSLAEEVVLAHS